MQECQLPAGVTSKPDSEGYFTYTRPEGKQGGHGVGWSELPRYSFKVPPGWKETPVSIADLGGTEVGRQAASLVWQQWRQLCCMRQAVLLVDMAYYHNSQSATMAAGHAGVRLAGPGCS